MSDIRLLVIDAHPVVAEGLQVLLGREPGLLVLGGVCSGVEGLELFQKLRPDLVVLDPNLAHLEGKHVVQLLAEEDPETRIVVFSSRSEERFLFQALRSGAHGFVTKDSSVSQLVKAIHYVWQGGIWVGPEFSPQVVEACLERMAEAETAPDLLESLSDREEEVLRLIVDGLDTVEIAKILAISKTTVAKHRISLMRKLKVKNSVELTRLAFRHGLVTA